MKGFQPYKAPGNDGIYPILLQKGLVYLLPHLENIFKLSILSGKLASSWLMIRTIFLPKVGKTDYTLAKAYRPISLMSFTLKTLERLIFWHLNDKHFFRFPLNRMVFSYREGHSTETALHILTNKIEQAFHKKDFTLAIFLDISGAFSNTSTKSLVNALAKRGAEIQIVKWTKNLLTQRVAVATLGNTEVQRRTTNGIAEGGIGSPPLFNCIGSDAMDDVEQTRMLALAFADDFNLIKSGRNMTQLGMHAQEGINKLCEWAERNSLQFNADKTKALVFTKKVKFYKPPLYINGKEIEYVNTFKYLGVTFDSKLNWKEHIKTQVKRAKASLLMSKKLVGKTWGINPTNAHWIYTAIVRPLLTYGSVSWVSCLKRETNLKDLTQVQRLACKLITSSMRSTPTAGMETLLGLVPIDLYIKQTALATRARLMKSGHWSTDAHLPEYTHTTPLNTIGNNIPELQYPQDRMLYKDRTLNLFLTQIADRDHFQNNCIRPLPWDPGILNVFTDGSKSEMGTGAAYIMKSHEHSAQDYMHLGEHATVFQAEITAITLACLNILDYGLKNHDIQFWVDSQSAIKALNQFITCSKQVLEAKRLLNKITEYQNTIRINWIPGHSGQLGNCVADALAKAGAEYSDEGLEPRMAVSSQLIRTALSKWTKTEHQDRWYAATQYRQTKLVLPNTTHNWRKHILKYKRSELRIITQLVTGHANLKRHRYLMGMEDTPDCEHCGEEQTAEHILTVCPKFASDRLVKLGKPLRRIEEIKDLNIYKLLQFAKATRYWNPDPEPSTT